MRLDSGGQTAVAAIGLPPWPTLRFGARSGEQARRTRGAQVKLGGVDVAVAVVAVASVGLWVALWLRERRFYELIFSLGASWNSGEFWRAHVCASVHTDRQADNYATCCAVSPFWWRISSHRAAKAKGLLVVPRWPFCDWPTLVGGKAKQSGEAKEEKQ